MNDILNLHIKAITPLNMTLIISIFCYVWTVGGVAGLTLKKCINFALLYKTSRPTLQCRATFGLLRSINPNMINHFVSQSQTCQLLKIKMLNGLAQHHRVAVSASPCAAFCAAWKWFLLKQKLLFFLIERKLWKVLQSQVELMRIDLNFKLPFFK